MHELILQYYGWLSGLTHSLSGRLADSLNLPFASALLFGVLGALAPCQRSASVAAMGFVTPDITGLSRVWGRARRYIAGRASVSLILGDLVSHRLS